MRGYPERTLATRAKWLLDTRKDAEVSATEWVEEMEAVLKELANAPEPEPDAYCRTNEGGSCVSADPRCMHNAAQTVHRLKAAPQRTPKA